MPNCPKCSKPVYFVEEAKALGKTWHKTCLKCTSCKKTLTPGNFSDKENQPYCNPCYQKNFGASGYRAGAGAGAANSYQWNKK
ncbi:cysteine-rich protein 1-like [Lytechinus variegatus]|uniref:cysteine-rich protein 1-like n=1 Tax=Lytechinus variegatus TaxID=7654 RepID=UPI001BB1D6A7|nr:cysteine-rich protein 1-like [Lytechinus variegatus]